MLQIVHPGHVAEPGDEGAIAIHEPVYPLTEGLTNARLSQLAAVALDRRPELAEWIDAPLLASRNWPARREEMERAHARPRDGAARARPDHDQTFSNPVPLIVIHHGFRTPHGRCVTGSVTIHKQIDHFSCMAMDGPPRHTT